MLQCLSDPNKGRKAVMALPWYTKENGFDRSHHYAEGERLDLRGITFDNISIPNVDLTAALLDEATFIDANLRNARLRFAFLQNCYFIRVNLSEAALSVTRLHGGQFFQTNISNADCIGAKFTDFNFVMVKAHGINFEAASFRNSVIQIIEWNKDTNFRSVDISGAAFLGDPLLKRHIQDSNWLAAKKEELCKSRNGRFLWFLWGFTSSHGQSFIRWLITSFVISTLYGVGYQFLPLQINLKDVHPVLAKFYFSVVTFTTLGFGDVLPKSNASAIVVMSEVICGYLMLGALISILADKFARRS